MNLFKKRADNTALSIVFKSARAAIEAKKIGSVLASNSHSVGALRCTSGIKFDGRHFGDVFVDNPAEFICWVGPVSTIQGNIIAPSVYVEGTVKGDVYADRVVIKKGGFIDGDTTTAELHIEDGGCLRGEKIRTLSGEYRVKGSVITQSFPTAVRTSDAE